MKISDYFTILPITTGLSTALSGSWWLYSAYLGWDLKLANTLVGVMFVYLLLRQKQPIEWLWSGFFIGVLWFWWIGVSLYYYHLTWLIPIAIIGVGVIYGAIFGIIGIAGIHSSIWISAYHRDNTPKQDHTITHLSRLVVASSSLLVMSFLHPLGFDWFKPEIVFVDSYIGIAKWQFGIVLISISMVVWRRNLWWLIISILAISPVDTNLLESDPSHTFKLIETNTTIADKWDIHQKQQHINQALRAIDNAIDKHYKIVVLPESIMPFFVNRNPVLLGKLLQRSHHISIIIGGLYLDHGIHRNSAYLFDHGRYQIANKVVLVPFGESNPLPQWASGIVNRLFFDGAVDYIASTKPTDWHISGVSYRNAICYEGTSEKLYIDHPRHMILISNNAWFVPSIEPTYQKLLLRYYSRKYGTTIYHSTNMSKSYIIAPDSALPLDIPTSCPNNRTKQKGQSTT